ncbi:MAG: hypothetical protein M3O28_01645 [Actinomycetota bacterium]|nr:hypothetical protein [Actinomycetota bacterium]MDP9168945.1 hypothetical protein [Actinomycetota bacterium]
MREIFGVRLSALVGARSGLLAVSGGALLWGTTGIGVRIIHDRSGLSAVPIGCYRLAIAAVVLALVFPGSGVRRLRASWRRHRWSLLLAEQDSARIRRCTSSACSTSASVCRRW